MFTINDIINLTLNQVAQYFWSGHITEETYNHYCYIWRDESFRYSDEVKHEAALWAKENNLPPPYSDRPNE